MRRTYKSLLDVVSKHCSQKSARLAGRTRRAEVDMVLGKPPAVPTPPAPNEGELMPASHLFKPPIDSTKSIKPSLEPDIVRPSRISLSPIPSLSTLGIVNSFNTFSFCCDTRRSNRLVVVSPLGADVVHNANVKSYPGCAAKWLVESTHMRTDGLSTIDEGHHERARPYYRSFVQYLQAVW